MAEDVQLSRTTAVLTPSPAAARPSSGSTLTPPLPQPHARTDFPFTYLHQAPPFSFFVPHSCVKFLLHLLHVTTNLAV